jgi:hypothetical protein
MCQFENEKLKVKSELKIRFSFMNIFRSSFFTFRLKTLAHWHIITLNN